MPPSRSISFYGGGGRSARGDKVINDNDLLTRLYGIGVHFDFGLAVFKIVFLTDDVARELALLRMGTKGFPNS